MKDSRCSKVACLILFCFASLPCGADVDEGILNPTATSALPRIPKKVPRNELWHLIEVRPEKGAASQKALIFTLRIELDFDLSPMKGTLTVTTAIDGAFFMLGKRELSQAEASALLITTGSNEVFSLPEKFGGLPGETPLKFGGSTVFLVRKSEKGTKVVVRRAGVSQPVDNVVAAFEALAAKLVPSEEKGDAQKSK